MLSVIKFLQKLVATIHNSYDDEDQFHPHKGYLFYNQSFTRLTFCVAIRSKDPGNLKVKSSIFEEINLAKENAYSKVQIESKYRFTGRYNYIRRWVGSAMTGWWV